MFLGTSIWEELIKDILSFFDGEHLWLLVIPIALLGLRILVKYFNERKEGNDGIEPQIFRPKQTLNDRKNQFYNLLYKSGIAFFLFVAIAIIAVLILNNSKRSTTQNNKTVESAFDSVIKTPIDSSSPETVDTKVDTMRPLAEVEDSTILTCQFITGKWSVVSEKNRLSTEITFKCIGCCKLRVISNLLKKSFVDSDSHYKIESKDEYGRKSILTLQRNGTKIAGILLSTDLDMLSRKEVTNKYDDLVFTRK